jgi:hypothetical protein
MSSQKVPGVVILHCNARTYYNTHLITFTVGPLRAHTHTCSFDPAIDGSTCGRFLLESSGVWHHPKLHENIVQNVPPP